MNNKYRFKIASNTIRANNRMQTMLGNLISESVAVDKIIKFASRYFIVISHDLDHYAARAITTKRIIGASSFRLCSLITAIRYLLSSLVGRKWMNIAMADANYLVTNQRLLSMTVSLGAFVIFFIGVLLQVNEMQYKFTLLDFMNNWKAKRLLPLSPRNAKRLSLIIGLMAKLLMKQAFWPLVFLTGALLVGPTIVAYFDKESGFILVPSLFFSVCFIIWLVQFICIVCAGFVAWSVPFFYLKFKFNEVHDLILWYVQCLAFFYPNNSSLLYLEIL